MSRRSPSTRRVATPVANDAQPLSGAVSTSDGQGNERAASALCFALAAGALGRALQFANGAYHPDAVFWLTVCAALGVLGLVLPRRAQLENGSAALVVPAMLGVLALQFGQLFTTPPGIYLRGVVGLPQSLFMLLAAAAVAVGVGSSPGRLGRMALPAVLLLHFASGVWMLRASPQPFIDVFVFQRDASVALLHGKNPYAMTFPDIYGGSSNLFYGPGLSLDGRLQFGFPYPPLSLLFATVGQLSQGDYRWAQLCAMTGAGALMGYTRPGPWATLAAALYLFTPRGLFVLEQGWTEPFAVFLLALVVFLAVRWPRAWPWALGLFWAIKQYFVFAVPLTLLLLPRPWRWRPVVPAVLRAGVVTLVVSLPLVLWDVPAFIRSAVTLQLHQPFRPDALSFLAHAYQTTGTPPPTALAFGVLALLLVLSLWRAPRTPAGFAGAVAVCFFGFFAFNKQAFCNYYLFVVGALCVAVAATGRTAQPK